MKVSKGHSQPETAAAGFVFPYMVRSTILIPGFDCDSNQLQASFRFFEARPSDLEKIQLSLG